MLRKSISVLLIAGSIASGAAIADSLVVDGIQASNTGERPTRGLTQKAVEAQWGAPMNRSAPVGAPPISSWEYAPFVVYFEYDHVIHSVAKR